MASSADKMNLRKRKLVVPSEYPQVNLTRNKKTIKKKQKQEVQDSDTAVKIENEDDEDFSENSANKICQWTCIENEETSARTIIFNNVILNSAEQLSSIGDQVDFEMGSSRISGTMVGHSELGITGMDLFNDMMTSPQDLEKFIRSYNIEPSPQIPGMIIQAYLLFCQKSKNDVWHPLQNFIPQILPQGNNVSEDEEDISGTFTDESENEDDNEKISTICEHCGYEAATTKGLQRHIVTNHPVEPVECRHCKKAFQNKAYMRRHIRSVHMGNNKRIGFNCTYKKCKFRFLSRVLLSRHINDVHCETYKCNQCDFIVTGSHSISKSAKLENHIRIEHENASREKTYFCDQCAYGTFSVDNLEKHLRKHTGESFICEVCSKVFMFRDALKQHVRNTHSKVKTFKCPDCMAEYSKQSDLGEHLMLLHGMRIFACNVADCNFFSKRAFGLQEHNENIHLEIKNYHCTLCDYSCYHKYNYTAHLGTKHGTDKFPCSGCGKDFNTKQYAQTHENICPLVPKPFSCDECPALFTTKNGLRCHCVSMAHRTEGIAWNTKGYIPKDYVPPQPSSEQLVTLQQ